MKNHLLALAAVIVAVPAVAYGQGKPFNGMRPADLRSHALINATVVTEPGTVIEHATVLINDGVITAVGADVTIPTGARTWDIEGHTVYAGLIDAAVLVETKPGPDGPGDHWNKRVHPQLVMAEQGQPDAKLRKSLRELGFSVAAVYPDKGIFRGSGAVLALAEQDADVLAYQASVAMALGFDHGGGWSNATYPGSLMGAIAVLRQTLLDAQWYAACQNVYDKHPEGNEPPMRSVALEALSDVIARRQSVLIDIDTELNASRAMRIADEFNLKMTLLGTGLEFRALPALVEAGLAVITPLKYPKRPEIDTLAAANRVTLRSMMTWEQAPTNARRLIDAGLQVALTTHDLKKRDQFHPNLRKAIKHGLSEEDALAALTTTPAALLGLSDVLGTITPGKAANLVVVKGSLFDEKSKIRSTWVNGRRHEITPDPVLTLTGDGVLRTSLGTEHQLTLDTTKKKPTLTIQLTDDDKTAAVKVQIQRDRLSFVIDGKPFETEGLVRFSGALTDGIVTGTGVFPDGRTVSFNLTMTEAAPTTAQADGETKPAPAAAASKVAMSDETEEEPSADAADADTFVMPPAKLSRPLGAYGLDAAAEPEDVLVYNATIWTCGPSGIIENGAMLVRNGRIEAVYDKVPSFPAGVRRLDLGGRHVTPGLVDCHSHTGFSGSFNEWTQANTAEVRVGDIIDPDAINWYRELAGGLTVANMLHGSSNPIGGQNAVVKIKWGSPAAAFRIDGAIEGIKFALGENVKSGKSRYPNTRMGVEAFIRDAFTAASDYRAEFDRYLDLPSKEQQRTMPPRRDLELDTLAEILQGERLVHCHSYRQDEILMLIRVADDFGFTIGTFQHALEGYKVADAIAEHGAGASSFSDWWAYKMEVMDAIPYNGALMTDVGVLVSFNSDSNELARRLNTEASKAVRYGGLDPHEALKLVTLNPARQLRIDDRVGSLEVGKDADFAIWSGDPLSTYSRCEQTWIEGACYFNLEHDKQLQSRDKSERQRLIQKIFADARKTKKKDSDTKDDKDSTTHSTDPAHVALHEWMEQQVRLGRDPDEIRPACCSDMTHWFMMNHRGSQ